MAELIDLKRFKKRRNHFIVSGIDLHPNMMYQLLFIKELESNEIKFTELNVHMDSLKRRDLVERKVDEYGVMFCCLTPKGRCVIKELLK